MYGLKKNYSIYLAVSIINITDLHYKSTQLHKTYFVIASVTKYITFKIALFIITFRFEEFLFLYIVFLLVLFSGIVFMWELSVIRIMK